MEKKGFEYDLFLKGVFGRNRKVKTERVELLKFSETPITHEAAMNLAKMALVALKPKAPYFFSVGETPITIEEKDYGGVIMTSTVFEAFSRKVLHEERVS